MTLSNDDLVEQLRRHCVQLRESFSSVQIVAVRHDDQDDDAGAVVFKQGAGSWFERYGAIQHWIRIEDEIMRQEGRGQPDDA